MRKIKTFAEIEPGTSHYKVEGQMGLRTLDSDGKLFIGIGFCQNSFYYKIFHIKNMSLGHNDGEQTSVIDVSTRFIEQIISCKELSLLPYHESHIF